MTKGLGSLGTVIKGHNKIHLPQIILNLQHGSVDMNLLITNCFASSKAKVCLLVKNTSLFCPCMEPLNQLPNGRLHPVGLSWRKLRAREFPHRLSVLFHALKKSLGSKQQHGKSISLNSTLLIQKGFFAPLE